MRSGAAPVPSNRSSQQKKQKAASLLQLTACFYVWSERLDSNQRPPAPKAGALPCCATLRDGMFCTQKALLWQGRPVWRPREAKGVACPEGKAASCGTGPRASLTRQADDDRGQGSIYRLRTRGNTRDGPGPSLPAGKGSPGGPFLRTRHIPSVHTGIKPGFVLSDSRPGLPAQRR